MKTRSKIVLDTEPEKPYITLMKMKIEFIADCIHLLNIERPLDLTISQVVNDWDAQYQDMGRRHEVRVSPRAARCRLSLIAHELVHASVGESHPHASDHGRVFKRTAKRLQKQLTQIGWKLHDKIYIKGVDL